MVARRYIRLPVYDEEGNELPQFVEYSLPVFQQQVPNSTLVIRSTEEPSDTVVEWRNIPGFKGYIINRNGDVMLADSPHDPYPAPVYPVLGRPHLRRYNLLGDDNIGHERSVEYFLDLVFPESSS